MNAFIYMLRREIWEHRAFVWVPLVIATLYTVAHIFGLAQIARVSIDGNDFYQFADFVDEMAWKDPSEREAMLGLMFGGYAMPFFIALGFMTFFYLLDALFADRKDRSILFWKSLPITDTSTVLSKLVTATVVAPIITLGWIFAMQIGAMMVLTIMVWMADGSAWDLVWSPMPFVQIYIFYAYVVMAVALWYAPIWGWLLLASAWARKAVFLWAVLPVVGVGVFEGIVFETHRFWELIGYRVGWGLGVTAFQTDTPLGVNFHNDMVDVNGTILDFPQPGQFFSNPDLYTGLVVAAAFVLAAIWLRRYRDDS